MISEATETKKEATPVTPAKATKPAVPEVPYTKQQIQNTTDMTSANAYGNSTLEDGQEVNILWTVRHGIPLEDMQKDAVKTIAFFNWLAKDQFVKFSGARKEAKTNGSTPAASDNGSSDKPKINYKDPISQADLPAELVEITVDVFAQEFDSFEITPKPDDKANVDFSKDGLEYPVVYVSKWKHDAVKQLLASLTTEKPIDPAKPEKYRIAGVLYWKKGNEYIPTKGKNAGQKSNYKDVVLVKPAF